MLKSSIVTALVALCASWVPVQSAEQGESFLRMLAGEWRARGVVWQSRSARPLSVLCRITSRLSADGLRLKTSGKCATTNASASVGGEIAFDSKSGTFDGPFMLTQSKGRTESARGRLKDGNLVVRIVRIGWDADPYDDRISFDETVRTTIVLTIRPENNASFRIFSRVIPRDKTQAYRAADIGFRRIKP